MDQIAAGESYIMTKILFVCLGNICRSPAAEAVMKDIVKTHGRESEFFIDSAGTSGHHVGEPADSRMIEQANKRSLHITSISRKFTHKDFLDFDYILVMDASNYSNMANLDSTGKYKHKVKILAEYASDSFTNYKEVPDPYYGGTKGFELVLNLLDNCCINFYHSLL